jgi:hypothetical protein
MNHLATIIYVIYFLDKAIASKVDSKQALQNK